MQHQKAAGPGASAIKYDILTALLSLSLHDAGPSGRLAQRLCLLITARMSWRTESFSVGVHEMARLWAVTDRTAKRELALMRAKGWISVLRPATRGRVATHKLHIGQVLSETRPCWESVGPDFAQRMGQGGAIAASDQSPADHTVVPFPGVQPAAVAPTQDTSLWGQAAQVLAEEYPARYRAWFAALTLVAQSEAEVTLAAPSAFAKSYIDTHLRRHLLAAITRIDPTIREVVLLS